MNRETYEAGLRAELEDAIRRGDLDDARTIKKELDDLARSLREHAVRPPEETA